MENTNNFSLAPVAPATPATVEAPATPALTVDDDTRFIVDLTSRTTSYCSMTATTTAEKATLYNAMNNPDKRIKDCINETVSIKDVFVEVVACTNTETGEVTHCPRTVIIDDKGVGYQAVSLGIFSALKKLFAVYGEPFTWEKPIKVKIKQLSRGTNKNILTLDVIG